MALPTDVFDALINSLVELAAGPPEKAALNALRYSSLNNEELNVNGTLIVSTAQVATFTSSDQVNELWRGLLLYLNVSAVSGTTPTLTAQIQAKDSVSAAYANLLAAPVAITGTGLFSYMLLPGLGTLGGGITQAQGFQLPRTWRFQGTIAGVTPTFTCSVGYCLLR